MNDYDAIVIGSGSGGLSAATALARAGQKVAIFEQHYLPGGYSQTFHLKGFGFSPGVHYVGGLEPGGHLRQIYEGLGMADDLVFFEINPDGYDHAVVGTERFDFPKGKEPLADRLKRRFPSDAAGIDTYLNTVCRISDEIGSALPAARFLDRVLLPLRMPTLLRYGLRPLGRFLASITHDPLLRAILSIQSGDHGLPPSRASTALHAGLVGYYMNGACYPRGGARSIGGAFIKQLKAHAGEIHLRTPVDQILVANRRALGVRLADGREVRAAAVISNADPGVTWGKLVAPEHLSARLRRRVARTRYSVSTMSLFCAVDMDLRAAGLDSGNCWYSRTPDIEAVYRFGNQPRLAATDEIPGLFLSVTTLKDPSLRSDGLHTVEAMSLASYDAFRRWEGRHPDETGDGYADLKTAMTVRMFDAIETFVPGFRDRVVFHTLGTPLTNQRYVASTRGGIYGTEKTIANLGPFSYPVRSEIEGLFECGASTLSPGVLGVTTSGLAAAQAVLGCRAEDLLDARGQTLRVYPSESPELWPEALRPVSSAPAARHPRAVAGMS
jgi:phytoene dehydrogenase-like protein